MARLQKGQLAPGIQQKSDRAKASTESIIRVAKAALVSGRFEQGDDRAFGSISLLARFEDAARGIHPQSVKTLKRNLDALYEGGTVAFRKDVANVFGKAETRRAPEDVRDTRLEDAVMDMTARYSDLLQRCKRLSAASPEVADELRRHLERYQGPHALRAVT